MNLQNDGNNRGFYPMYLGEELGLLDNIHECYPDIAELHAQLLRNRWHWLEIDLSKDAADMQDPELEEGTTAMIRNLNFQFTTDSAVANSIHDALAPFCSNTEMLGLIQEWNSNEFVHGMQYSEIIKKAFPEPNDLLEEIKNTKAITDRLNPLLAIVDDTAKMGMLYKLGLETDVKRMRKQIIMCHATLLAIEGIAFAASFAATFGVARAYKAYDGIKNSIQLITRDELDQHVNIGLTAMRHLRNEWPEEYEECITPIRNLYNEVYRLEGEWMVDHLFVGVRIPGLNATLLNRYVRWLMAPICDSIKVPYDHTREATNPLPWMDDYINLGDIQVAAQEGQVVNYNVNIINDDVGDGAFEEDFGIGTMFLSSDS